MKTRGAIVALFALLLVTTASQVCANDSAVQNQPATRTANPSPGLSATPSPSDGERDGVRGIANNQALRNEPPVSAQVEGRELAQQLLALKPEAGFTNIGKLVIRGPKKQRREVNYQCRVIVTATNWTSHYSASQGTNVLPGFSVEHRDGAVNRYFDDCTNVLSASQIAASFAGSDFSMADLGLEFFHWPDQRVVKWEMKRSFGCKVLESRNPEPAAGGYSRVVSWIHAETGGLIQAEAYDARGKLLKEFRPTETEKVNGRHELKEMEIENVQAGTRTTLVFEL